MWSGSDKPHQRDVRPYLVEAEPQIRVHRPAIAQRVRAGVRRDRPQNFGDSRPERGRQNQLSVNQAAAARLVIEQKRRTARSGTDRQQFSPPLLQKLAERRRREQLAARGGFNALQVRGIARVEFRIRRDFREIDGIPHQPMTRRITSGRNRSGVDPRDGGEDRVMIAANNAPLSEGVQVWHQLRA